MDNLPVDAPFMSTREMVMEIRNDIKELNRRLTEHLEEFEDHKAAVITKQEFDLMREINRVTRRYIITTLISLGGMIIAAATIIIGTR